MKRAASLLSLIALAACTQTGGLRSSTPRTPLVVMTVVAKQVQTCWFKKRHPALAPYKMASELDSYSGAPRILIVPRNNPAGLPKLVAQAEKRSGQTIFTTFGPLLDSKHGATLDDSLRSWARGSRKC